MYLLLILLTPLFPILLSFDKKVRYINYWKFSLIAASLVAVPYLIWDQLFTVSGFWGFNETYLQGFKIGDLPLEEVSFFFVVPFACTFIYQCVKYYFRNANLKLFNQLFYGVFVAFILFIGCLGLGGWYTIYSVSVSFVVLLILLLRPKPNYEFIPVTFVFSLIPFIIINGILTGSFLPEPIVWYNEAEFSQMRLFTIPLEDISYSFGLIVLNLIVFEAFLMKHNKLA